MGNFFLRHKKIKANSNESRINQKIVGSKEFFNTFRNKNLIIYMSEYLNVFERIKLHYLNKFLKKITTCPHNEFSLVKNSISSNAFFQKNFINSIENLKPTEIASLEKEYTSLAKLYNNMFLEEVIIEHKVKYIRRKQKELNLSFSGEICHKNIIFEILKINNSLEKLDLHNSQTKTFFESNEKILNSPINLKVLMLYQNFFGTDSGKYLLNLGQLLMFTPKLIFINLSDNLIDEKGGFILAEKLCFLINLESLYLNNNPLKDEGVGCILKSCSLLYNLKLLSVNETKLTNGIISSLSNFLKISKIEILELNNNSLTENVEKFGKALRNQKYIRSLFLGNCDLGDVGCKTLLKNLVYNNSLTYLNLSNNNSTNEIYEDIKNLYEKNKIFKSLSILGTNDLFETNLKIIKESLKPEKERKLII